MLRLRNTLTRTLEEFTPIDGKTVRMYACGPTVYDYGHIGNFRTFLAVDLLRRYLKYRGYTVFHVMNITDIDDKIIREALAHEKNNQDATTQDALSNLRAFTDLYTQRFLEDLDVLNIETPELLPRATDHIPEMIDIMKRLDSGGHTYATDDGSLYFSISTFQAYGRLSGLKIEGNTAGARVDVDEYEKADARDFVLWKAPKSETEPRWETPFGEGRPGWHLECSAMSMKYLGESFDVHCGGVDLIFPHHENEIAQSEAATGNPFVRYWFHSEFLLVEGEKMAKSKGNYFTVRDLVERGHSPMAIRYLLLSVPYRTQLNFTMEGLRSKDSSLERLRNFRRRVTDFEGKTGSFGGVEGFVLRARTDFEMGMDDDLNTAAALGAVFDLVHDVNIRMDSGEFGMNDKQQVLELLESIDSVLGILGSDKPELLEPEIEAKIDARNAARRSRNFALADQLRDELVSQGIILEDTPQGTRWKKK